MNKRPYFYTPSSNELYHHGVLGMKWGVRRYQNRDGTLTEAGKRRLGRTSGPNSVQFDNQGRVQSGQENRASSRIHSEVASDYKNISNISERASQAARGVRNIAEQSVNRARRQAASNIDVSNISDRDLQAMINRMSMERTFKSLTTEDVGAGRRYVGDVFQVAGEVLAIGASAASIAMAIHQLKA